MSTSTASIGHGAEVAIHRVDGDIAPGGRLRSAGTIRIAGGVDRSEVSAGAELVVAGRAGGSTLVAEGDMTLAWAHSCALSARGTVRFLGSGASDCDIDTGGDLIAMSADGAIRSGHVRVGGHLQVRALAGREGAWLRVVMHDTRPAEARVRVDVIHPGVELVVCGELLRFDRRHTDVRIGVADGRAVIHSP